MRHPANEQYLSAQFGQKFDFFFKTLPVIAESSTFAAHFGFLTFFHKKERLSCLSLR
jgi:hypothetical protein